MSKKHLRPFVKWVGGKTQLISEIKNIMPLEFNNYFEPFVGGGALFFEIAHNNSIISDMNEELINVYKVIKSDPYALMEKLEIHKSYHSFGKKEYYLKIRNLDREENFYKNYDVIERAARFIFLNKTCFNGIYRVNSKNHFNVPYNFSKNPSFFNKENILAVSNFLNNKNIKIYNKDFEEVCKKAKKMILFFLIHHMI